MSNKVVIIEGPDGGGKTFLVEQLKQLDCWNGLAPTVAHEGPPQTEDMFAYYSTKLLEHLRAPAPVICDRFHVGETVYGPACRGRSSMSDRGRVLIDRLCAANDVLIILALPDFETCYFNWGCKSADYVKDNATFWQVYHRYQALEPYYYVYDYEAPEAFDELVKELREPLRTLPPGCLGPTDAEVLFVGEQTNGPFDLPFFALNNSSEYLNSALQEAHCSNFAMVNALNQHAEANDLCAVLDALPRLRKIIALGALAERSVTFDVLKASQIIKSRQITVEHLPHPQAWKRFHASDRGAYVEALRETFHG